MQPLRRAWNSALGPSGWRSLVGPSIFAVLAIALLVYDHIHQHVPALVFWLTLGLIVTVFLRMIETNRRQSQELAAQRWEALNDQVTGLRNRTSLEADIGAAAAAPGEGWVLVLIEVEGLEAQNDRFGYAAGDRMAQAFARKLADSVVPVGGIAYRLTGGKLAALVPLRDQRLGEIALAVTGSLHGADPDAHGAPSYGEVAVPAEAADADSALRLAGGRLAANRQRRHRSARRQAHAVLIAALEARYPDRRENLRVAAFRAIALARRLQLDREQTDDIALAAGLQQVGLLSVPESMLEKDRLDEGERAVVRSHTVEGEKIVAAAPGLASVAHLVRASAEHVDGSGYPDGLAGDAIPLGARVVAVAVAYSAMTGRRPHRQPASPAEALAELRRNAGTQFDPDVVEALAAELDEEVAVGAHA